MRAAVLLVLLLMSADAEAVETVSDITFGEKQFELYTAADRFLNAEGAFRSAKTWTALAKIRLQLEEWPGQLDPHRVGAYIQGSGIRWAMSRWTEDDLHQKLIPDWRLVCALLGVPHGEWNTSEGCFDFYNGSRVYGIHLKTSQITTRFAKVRGLTVAGFYIDQAEEVPEDVLEEASLRISQPGFPQQFIITPNPVPETHHIARRWSTRNPKPGHRLIQLSIWDNAHNLSPETVQAAEALYPPGHPARRTKLEGLRGLDVRGTPVYTGAFVRSRHVPALGVAFNPQLALCELYDFGFHHPCVVFLQWAPWGHLAVLGGVMGQDLHLDEFLPIVERYRAKWFPKAVLISAGCDPAGANENAQGIKGLPVSLLREWYREHGQTQVTPRYLSHANAPEYRRAAIDRGATYMRHQGLGGAECFAVDAEHWALVGRDTAGRMEERYDSFFIDGLELGYVLEEREGQVQARHSGRLGTYYVPKKDGWFEHAQNCFEYGLQLFVQDLPMASARAPEAHRQFLIDVERAAQMAEKQALIAQQTDLDEDPFGDKIDGLVPATPMRSNRGRSGY